jgi:hypothetical protein
VTYTFPVKVLNEKLPVDILNNITIQPAVPRVLFAYSGPYNTTPQYTIPDSELNLIAWIWMVFTSSSAGTNRNIRCIITTDGRVEAARYIAPNPQPPGTGINYHFFPGAPYEGLTGDSITAYIPTAPLLLPPKWTIAVGDFFRVDDTDVRSIIIVGTKIPIV